MRLNWIGIPSLFVIASVACAQNAVVHFSIDASRDVKPISRYIYGVNQFHLFFDGLEGPWSNLTFTRLGGNRFTAYNWTNNASQAGNDYQFHNDDYLVTGDAYKGIADSPGGALVPVIELAKARNAACLLTVPINGYVAADKNADSGDVRKSPDYLKIRFRKEEPRKGSAFSLTPPSNSQVIYQDEFVNWLKTNYPYGQTDPVHPIWLSLDNEPDYWQATHPEIHPKNATYAELIDKTVAYADAIKRVEPNALIFGPANYGWRGFISLQDAADAKGRDFQEVYLRALAAAEKTYGRRLLDVLDVHWYPEATGGGIRIDQDKNIPALLQARIEAPRSLWDPTYVEASWITKDSLGGKSIRLIPRQMEKIARNYPGTRLSISEYDFGGGTNISGSIAEADALGIFGHEGVFAAALWTINNVPYTAGAFEMFRNYDGKSGTFGDVSIRARTDDIGDTSIYASLDSREPGRIILVVINKSNHPIRAVMSFAHTKPWSRVLAYQLTVAGPNPKAMGLIPLTKADSLDYAMPGSSVSTIVLFSDR